MIFKLHFEELIQQFALNVDKFRVKCYIICIGLLK